MRSSDLLARPSKDQPLPWEDLASAKKLFAAIDGVQDARYGLPLPSRPRDRRRIIVAMSSTLAMLGLVAALWIVRAGGDKSASPRRIRASKKVDDHQEGARASARERARTGGAVTISDTDLSRAESHALRHGPWLYELGWP